MLNRPLYLMLRKNFGEVRIRNENVRRIEERMPDGKVTVHERGEHYAMGCPLCNDEHFRFTVSYKWLTKRPFSTSTQYISYLANCYNEDCDVRSPEFYEPLLDDLLAAQMGLLDMTDVPTAQQAIRRANRRVTLPTGRVSLKDLSVDHPAIAFIQRKYRLPVAYLADVYGVTYAEGADESCPRAQGRVIFPIYIDRLLYSWQGRAIDSEVKPRWFLPPGFVKCFYNQDMVAPHEQPILAEGIPSAIACGPRGIAIFGKHMNTLQAKEFGERWHSVLIATDPETFVPDNRQGGSGRIYAHELRDLLAPFVRTIRMLKWPSDILELAALHNNEEDVTVPDPADLGLRRMKELIDASL